LGQRWARALQDSGRTVVPILINEYGYDRFNTTLMRGDPTDFERRACEGADVIYACLSGPADE
jgi:hypothetical protein